MPKNESSFKKIIETAVVFMRLGMFAFGGPVAHIAMMQKEVVEKRNWLDEQEFLDLVGATNLIPGPNSTEMAIHCGYIHAGLPGLIVAGTCFIVPAVLMTGLLALFYMQYGTLPDIEAYFFGIKPVVLAIILTAVVNLGKKAVKTRFLGAIGIIAAALAVAGFSTAVIIFFLGFIGILAQRLNRPEKTSVGFFSGLFFTSPTLFPMVVAPVKNAASITIFQLFLVFLKIGSILFGSGYVLIAFLNDELVLRLGWLTSAQLMDAVAIGQFTPGPVLSTATFIGYQILGVNGALGATLGIFLPSFLLVLILNPFLPRMRNSRYFSAFLDAVNVASLGLILWTFIEMSLVSLTDWRSAMIAVGAIAASWRFPAINSAFYVIAGALAGKILLSF